LDYGYIYTQLTAGDSSVTQQTVLPELPASGYTASSSLLVRGEFVHVALSAMYRGISSRRVVLSSFHQQRNNILHRDPG
jgi:hypothetical protein